MNIFIRCILATPLIALTALVAMPASADSWAVSNCTGGHPQMTTMNGLSEHPEIVLLFWQNTNEWTSGTQPYTRGQWIGAALSIVGSPFYGQVMEYGESGGMSLPRLAPYAPIWTGQPPTMNGDTTSNFTNQDIIDITQEMILTNRLPAPSTADRTIYVVILPSGSNDARACGGGGGCNFDSNNAHYTTAKFGAAYISGVGGPGSAALFGHETVESIAHYVNAEVTAGSCTNYSQGAQIADICQCATCGDKGSGQDTLNGTLVGSYYSFSRGLCIIPEYWGDLEVATSQTGSWTTPTGDIPMRQIYGGGGGVLATSTDDKPYWYSQANGWYGRFIAGHWEAYPISSTLGSTMAVGGSHILQLPLNTDNGPVWANTGSNAWYALPALPNGPMTGGLVANVDGGVVVVTDQYGQPWYWDWNTSSWFRFGGPGDQFVVDDTDVLGLTPDHVGVYRYGGYQFGGQTQYWVGQSNTGNPFVSLVGGPDDGGYWGAVSQTNYDLYSAGTTSVISGSSGIVDWASSPVAGGFMAQFGYIYNDYGAYFYESSGHWYWNTTYGAAGRIIGGSEMFLTACVGPGGSPCVAY